MLQIRNVALELVTHLLDQRQTPHRLARLARGALELAGELLLPGKVARVGLAEGHDTGSGQRGGIDDDGAYADTGGDVGYRGANGLYLDAWGQDLGLESPRLIVRGGRRILATVTAFTVAQLRSLPFAVEGLNLGTYAVLFAGVYFVSRNSTGNILVDLIGGAISGIFAALLLIVAGYVLPSFTGVGTTPSTIHSARKDRTVALARHFSMYLTRKHTKMSSSEIGGSAYGLEFYGSARDPRGIAISASFSCRCSSASDRSGSLPSMPHTNTISRMESSRPQSGDTA